MFDVDPNDKHERFLLSHPESDCIFEVFSRAEAERLMSEGPCDDVTGVQHFEDLFIKSKGEKCLPIE